MKKKQEFKTRPKNLEEQAISLVGRTIYEKLIKEYTEKQWRKKCCKLSAFIIKRLPVRFIYDNNYFDDKYQGIPIGGYTKMVENMIKGIQIKLNTDLSSNKPKTIIIYEYLLKYQKNMERYYTVNDKKNNLLAKQYKELASKEEHIYFGGRLGNYKYYNMDDVIKEAILLCENI